MSFFGFGRPRALGFDVLAPVFAALESKRILARLYPEAGRREAYDLVARELASAERRGSRCDGFCFCDALSFDHLEEAATLAFNFGAAAEFATYRETWTAQVAVGREVASALDAAGLEVAWTGEPSALVTLVDVRWRGPRVHPELTGPRLPIDRPPKRVPLPPVRSVFFEAPFPSPLAHALFAQLARRLEVPMFGPPDGTALAAVDFKIGDRHFDCVTGANHAGVPFGGYLLRTRDLARECPLFVDVVPRASAPPGPRWSDWSDRRDQRLRLVATGATDATFEGSTAIGLDAGIEALLEALGSLRA